ncbi:MAG: redoxin domain-containing protein [Cytophagales bacterium]|nr:redoxin domain-containing protein [Cytophagales bacterium]
MKLQVGQKAIDFDKETFDGQRVHLAALQGKRILLSFFRNTACPFCNLRVHQLSKLHPELKAQGLEMVFFFESSNKTILRSSFHSGLSPISLIGDPDKEVYRAYGVESNLLKMASHFFEARHSGFEAPGRGPGPAGGP